MQTKDVETRKYGQDVSGFGPIRPREYASLELHPHLQPLLALDN